VQCADVSGLHVQAHDEEPTVPVKCYWKSEIHFTPVHSSNCIAPGSTSVESPICEPLPGEMGLGGYYGHYQGHWLSATAFLINSTANATVKAIADAAISQLSDVMDAWRAKYDEDGYLFPYDPLVWDKLLAGNGAGPYYSVPFYTLHKIMAGLLDQYLFAGSHQAFDLVRRMASWVHRRVEATIASGGMELWQKVLLVEWGGMNDVLFHLYEHTADPTHLSTARRFNAYVFTAPLAAGVDDIHLQPFPHANFHLPEVIGNARAFEMSGNLTDKMVVDTFMDALLTNHSYATGGSNSGECWQAPRDLGAFLSAQTQESCTQYNVLKIARRQFLSSGDVSHADFYERALWNGILGNQKRQDNGLTSYIYMLPLGGVQTKPWGESTYGFPCCWGTLSESFAKLSDSVFFVATDRSVVFVNQFVNATARFRPSVRLEQQALFPIDPRSTARLAVRLEGAAKERFALKLRVPSWLLPGSGSVTLKTALEEVPVGPIVPGSYLAIDRTWADGDALDVSFPLALTAAPLNDYHAEHNATYAYMYGPLVLAGVNVATDIFVPRGHASVPTSFIRRSSSTSLEFEASAADGSKMKMIPLRYVMDEPYVVYFMTAGTKPPQPAVHYCPHSTATVDGQTPWEPLPDDGDDCDEELVSAGPPSLPPHAHEATQHLVSSRGVHWGLSGGRVAVKPRVAAAQPAPRLAAAEFQRS